MAAAANENFIEKVHEAYARLSELVALPASPLEACERLTQIAGQQVLLKQEYQLPPGSFKMRGAANKISIELQHRHGNKAMQVVCSSSGNHALACSCVCTRLGISSCTVFVPTTVSEAKAAKLEALGGVQVVRHGDEVLAAEVAGRQFAAEKQSDICYVPPYGDWEIMFGQATAAYELLPWPAADWPGQLANHYCAGDHVTLLVPAGGGGLLGGVAMYAKLVGKLLGLSLTVIGCQPANDCALLKSIAIGRGLTYEEAGSQPTLSTATAGGVEAESPTVLACREFVDDWLLVDEAEIARATLLLSECVGRRLEPGACLPAAALLQQRKQLPAGAVILFVTGCNVGEDEWQSLPLAAE